MKKIATVQLLAMMLILMVIPGCEIIGDIFQAGIWVGIILVVIIAALVIWLINKFR